MSDANVLRVRKKPRISVSKLAEYMTATPARRQTIIREQIVPLPYIAPTYREAQREIDRFLEGGLANGSDFVEAISTIEASQGQTPHRETARRLNLDAMKSFHGMANQVPLSDFRVLPAARHPKSYIVGGITVSVRPSVFLRSLANADYIGCVKLNLTKSHTLDAKMAAYFGACLHWFLEQKLKSLGQPSHKAIFVLDIATGYVHSAPPAYKKRRADIEAACNEIRRGWDDHCAEIVKDFEANDTPFKLSGG